MNLSRYDLMKRAKEVSRAYLEQQETPGDTVVKIAKRDGLNDNQIARVCEMANHEIRGQIFKNRDVDQSRVVFPAVESVALINSMAKPDAIIEQQKEASMTQIPDEYFKKPQAVLMDISDQAQLMQKSASITSANKIASKKEQLRLIDVEYTKVAGFARRALYKFGALRADFFKQASSDLRFGVHSPEDIVKMVVSVDMPESIEFFEGNLDLMKEAMPTDQLKNIVESMRDFINPDLKVNYIIGDSPLLIKYKGAVTASRRVQRKVKEMQSLYDDYEGLEKSIAQTDIGDNQEGNNPEVAGLAGKKH